MTEWRIVKDRLMPDYSLIIPAYNEEAFLPTTLAAAREAMAAVLWSGELIVVDNNSSDSTSAVALAHGADRVVFEPLNQIARARNAGAAASSSPWLVFVDADTRFPPELLRIALDALASETVAGGGARVSMEEKVTPMVARLVTTWNRISRWLNYAAGSFFYCRRDSFEAAGGFEEKVYAGEEIWLARGIKAWAKARGMSFLIIEEPPVITSGRKSDWFTTGDFVRQLAILFLLPGATRSKRLCALWYRRPDAKPE